MRPKKPLQCPHSAFTDPRILESEEYLKFQKALEVIKSRPTIEKVEGKREVAAKTFNSPLRPRRSAFAEIPQKVYFQKFPIKAKAKKHGVLEKLPLFNANVGESVVSEYHRPVTAYEMGDAIAVFSLSNKNVRVVHFSSGLTTIKDVFDRFSIIPPEPEIDHRIYLVGGDGSKESLQLRHNIHSALLIYFGPKGKIAESFIHSYQSESLPYISVACTPKKEFFYCRHD